MCVTVQLIARAREAIYVTAFTTSEKGDRLNTGQIAVQISFQIDTDAANSPKVVGCFGQLFGSKGKRTGKSDHKKQL